MSEAISKESVSATLLKPDHIACLRAYINITAKQLPASLEVLRTHVAAYDDIAYPEILRACAEVAANAAELTERFHAIHEAVVARDTPRVNDLLDAEVEIVRAARDALVRAGAAVRRITATLMQDAPLLFWSLEDSAESIFSALQAAIDAVRVIGGFLAATADDTRTLEKRLEGLRVVKPVIADLHITQVELAWQWLISKVEEFSGLLRSN